jgi:hypothetical protein
MKLSALAIGLLFAIPLADSVYRIPVQVSEVVDIVEYVGDTPDVRSAFLIGVRASSTMLRPMRQVHTKLLLEFTELGGTRYHPVFRGLHAALGVLLILAFVVAARPASFVDVCAMTCGLAVLVGLHTFSGLFREAYPVNHFLVVTLYGWAVVILAQRGRGIVADIAAAACVALALLTLESGILVAIAALAAHLGGWRGVSKRGLALIGVVLLAYIYLRVGYLGIEAPRFAERPTAFGSRVLSSEEQLAQFGDRRPFLYAYNTLSAASAIVFSQPSNGRFTLLAAWQNDQANPWMLVQIVASLVTTAVIVWSAVRRRPDGRRGYHDPHCLVAGAVIAANAVMSYLYAKDEVVAFGGTFYAFAFYAASRDLLITLTKRRRTAIVGTALACALMALWATRVAGFHVILREQAFSARNDWVPIQEQGRATALRREALSIATASPRGWPSWVPQWLGER